MSYFLWHNGNEHGPYRLSELVQRRDSGQWPEGALWRRHGQANWSELVELDREAATVDWVDRRVADTRNQPPAADEPDEPKPSGNSILGTALHIISGIMACMAVLAFFVAGHNDQTVAATLLAGALVLVALGTFFHIHAVLRLIAYRLRR
jgi:hypothetical protein